MDLLTPQDGAGTIFEPIRLDVTPGVTLRSVAEQVDVPDFLRDQLVVYLNGRVCRDLDNVYTLEGDSLAVAIVPAGGGGGGGAKRVLAAVAILAVAIVASVFVGPAIATFTGSAAIGQAAAAGMTLIGSMVINALIPPPSPANPSSGRTSNAGSPEESPTYSLGGQGNHARLYATAKRVYGRYRVYADLATTPLLDNVGTTSKISGLYYFSAGDCEIEDLRFGDLPFETFEPRYKIRQNTKRQTFSYVHAAVGYDDLAFNLDNTQWLQLQTKVDAVKATVDLTFPRGLVLMQGANRRDATVPIRVRWRLKNSGDPWNYLGRNSFYGASFQNSGGVTLKAEYDVGSTSKPWTRDTYAWIVQTKVSDDDTDTRILIYRDGTKILQSKDYSPGTERTEATADGVRYVQGAFLGDTRQSEDNKSEVYYELLIEEPITGNAVRVTNNTREPFTVSVEMEFPDPGVYEIEVQRTEGATSSEAVFDDVAVTLLKSFAAGPVLNLAHRATLLEMQVIATDQLRGAVPPINALVTSRLKDITSSGWRRDSDNDIVVK